MPAPDEMPVGPDTTVGQAAAFVRQHRRLPGGCLCPACGSHRVCKRYRITGRLAHRLARLRALCEVSGAAHIRDWVTWNGGGMDVTILRFYGLIVRVGTDPQKPFGKSGVWKPTAVAEQWMDGTARVPIYVIVDDGHLIGQARTHISFADTYGVPWNPESAYDGPPPKK